MAPIDQVRRDDAAGTTGPEHVREAVITVARRLFAERGIHAVSVREIAREVGVSHTLLHLYFGSKEEIVRQVLGSYDGRFADNLMSAQNVDQAVGDTFRALARDKELVRVLAAALVEGIVPQRIEAEALAQRAFVQRLESLAGEPKFDPRVVSALFGALAIGWAVAGDWLSAAVESPAEDSDKLVGQLAELLEHIVRNCT